ncbi:MAG: hypothetical protein M1839_008190 [Geoglossum umbratile]|nr:MAG: hypothetical protein M1839_008190 [Geoglossum umbratile]
MSAMDTMPWYADERFTLSSESDNSRDSRSPHRSPLIMLPAVTGPLEIPQWSSRAMSLRDRFRYENPKGCIRVIMARVFKTLLALCMNDEAVKSYSTFETIYNARGGKNLLCRPKSDCASCLQLRSSVPAVVVTQHAEDKPVTALPATVVDKTSVMDKPVCLIDHPKNATKDCATDRSLSITTVSNPAFSVSGCSSLSGRSSPGGSSFCSLPRYMSPTIASMSQASSSSVMGTETRSTTPTEASVPHMAKPRKWFTTGMSLTSTGRSNDGTPRGKKEGSARRPGNQMRPSDKVQPERSNKTPTSGSHRLDLCKGLPTEKALPSPPIAQLIGTGIPAVQRGLLDAADLPLRRSPPGNAWESRETEEWPVLLPRVASRASSVRQLAEEDSSNPESPFTGVRLAGNQGLEGVVYSVNSLPPQVTATIRNPSNRTTNRQTTAAAQVQRKPVPRPVLQTLNDTKPLSGVSGNVGCPAPRTRTTDQPSRLPTKSATGAENRVIKPIEKKDMRIARTTEPSGRHPSSIPIIRKANSPLDSSRGSDTEVAASKRQVKTARNSIAIFEDDQVAGDADVDTDDAVSPAGVKVPSAEALATLEARSSPCARASASRSSRIPHTYSLHTKTPSKNLPRLGPILRISSVADLIIMGPAEGEPSSSSSGKKTPPALRRAVVINELQKSSKHLDKRFAIERDAQTVITNKMTSSKQPQPRPKSAGGDIKRMCGLITVRDQKSWSMDATRLILKKENAIIEGESRRDDPFTEFQHAMVRKSEDDVEPQVASKDDDASLKLASGPGSGDDRKSIQVVGVTGLKTKATKIHASVTPRARIPNTQRGPTAGATLSNNRTRGSRVAHRPQFTPSQRPPSSVNSTNSDRPPRSSSRVPVPDYTIGSSSVASSASKGNQPPLPTFKDAVETQSPRGSAMAENLLGPSSGSEAAPTVSPSADVKQGSNTSKISQAPSAKTLAITKIRGLFRKNTSPVGKMPSPKKGKKFTVNNNGSPLASPGSGGASASKPWPRIGRVARSAGTPPIRQANLTGNSFPTPGPTPSRPSESAEINALAMSLLNSARNEPNSPKKEHLLALGKAMVESITNARDAEKAMEEAKMAAKNAELYFMKAKKSVLDVTNVVREWQEADGGANSV